MCFCIFWRVSSGNLGVRLPRAEIRGSNPTISGLCAALDCRESDTQRWRVRFDLLPGKFVGSRRNALTESSRSNATSRSLLLAFMSGLESKASNSASSFRGIMLTLLSRISDSKAEIASSVSLWSEETSAIEESQMFATVHVLASQMMQLPLCSESILLASGAFPALTDVENSQFG